MAQEPTHQVSAWISFLRLYGPTPQGENSFDERIEASLRRWNVDPITVELEHLQELLDNFKSEAPRSVILTGTAGDGKTYYCREVWRALKGEQPDWNPDAMIQKLKVGGRSLVVIKDLSEITGAEKKRQLSHIADAFAGRTADTVYLVAANDGQILEGWSLVDVGEDVKRIRREIEDLLVGGGMRSKKFNFDLYNLSLTSSEKIFPRVLKAVLEHSGWASCSNCQYFPAADGEKPCPIIENKRRLEGGNAGLVQERLRALLELSELNGLHLPIRQLLILVSNALLGCATAKDGLLTCKDVPKVLEGGSTSAASLYRNIFGENLTERRRDAKAVFRVLRRFGIGSETSNIVDNILIFGSDDPSLQGFYGELMLSDPHYGADATYQAKQQAYLEGGQEEAAEEFLRQLSSQRQRLFFVIPQSMAKQLRLWQLTAFQYADEYLNEVHHTLLGGGTVKPEIVARLVRGLNRIFTGMLAKNDKALILATSGSYSQARVCMVYEDSINVRNHFRGESVQIEADPDRATPRLVVSLAEQQRVGLPLNLLRYEYLSRVAEGALPTSFSREVYEDILAFKSSLLGGLALRRRGEEGSEAVSLTLRLITRLNPDGMIGDPEDIDVRI